MKIENKIFQGDALDVLKTLPDNLVNCIVTSPPYYGLRDYGCDGQIGLEESPEEYINKLVSVFREAKRVLKDDGTLWLNIGDSYAGSGKGAANYPDNAKKYKQATNKGTLSQATSIDITKMEYKAKDLIGIPWMLAFALRADGWYLRQDIIWHKTNPMPEPVKDRCTKSHEYIFLLSKKRNYYFDYKSIQSDSITQENRAFGVQRNREYNYNSKENLHPESYLKKRNPRIGIDIKGGNQGKGGIPNNKKSTKRSVWTIPTKPYNEAHFATFPQTLIVDCIKAGCSENGVVLDMFSGSGTTACVAAKLNRKYIGIELNPEYIQISEKRLYKELGIFR